MIRFLNIVILISFLNVNGQKETLTFKISKPQSEIKLFSADTVFHIKKQNLLGVEITGKNEVFRVTALNGRVSRRPNNVFLIFFDIPGETVVKVYEKLPDGTSRLGLTEAFKVVGPPRPDILVCGVKSDSVIDKKHLIKVGSLSAKLNKSRIDPAIISYDMILPADKGNDTIHIIGPSFPIGVKNKLYEVKEGQVLIFENIQVLLPNREQVTVNEILVFIARTDQYSVGHRDETIRQNDDE